jgi:two-component system CheB/CheR fusion protein
MVIFGQQDLGRAVPFPRIDLIVCRNLLIYFKPELQQQILDSFAYSLSRYGYLFLGKAETARPSNADFELADKRWKVYRCLNCPLGLAPRHGASSAGLRPNDRRGLAHLLESGERPVASEGSVEAEIVQLRRFNEQVLRLLPVGVVVIDRGYRIVTISGSARRLLGVRELGVDQDFLHTVRGLPYTRVRSAIDSVFRERTPVTLSDLELDPAAGGDGRYLLLSIVPMQLEATMPDLGVVSVTDVTEQVQTRRRLEAVQAEQAQLVDELSGANKRLSDLNKELQDANEELQAANEELMLTQEELQASNEEFEATNEELQATNEELETNNEELQATNEELEATNEELSARTQELFHLTRTLEAEQARLGRVVEMAPVGIVVLRGQNLDVESFNATASEIFDLAGARKRPLVDVLRATDMEAVLATCREAFRKDVEMVTPAFESPRSDTSERFCCRVSPTHDAYGNVDALVLYIEAASDDPAA